MLNKVEKDNPFKVPDNYFQKFNSDIMSKLPEKKKKTKVVLNWRTLTKWSAVAAAIASIAIIGINYSDNTSSHPIDNSIFVEQVAIDNKDQQLASLQDDYYLFLEDEATQMMYKDSFYSDQL